MKKQSEIWKLAEDADEKVAKLSEDDLHFH